jgi:glycosyltransferase involved in cell wall biosynthesis
VVKTSKAGFSVTDREDMLDRIRQIRSTIETSGTVPKVYLLHGDLTPEEMNGLYHHRKIKAMISFTHGEGFGRPLLEFGITGKPILASNWSGHLDFLFENGILLQGQLKPVHESAQWENIILKGSNWYYVDYGYAAGVIRDLDSNYKKYLSKSRKQKQHIKDNFTLDRMTDLFTKQVEANVPSAESFAPKFDIPTLEELQTYESGPKVQSQERTKS